MRCFWRGMPLVYALLLGTACGVTDTDEHTPVDTVEVTPPSIQVMAGTIAALTAKVTDDAGNVVRDRRVVWASADPGIATVSESGVVTGVSVGRVEVAATAEGKSGTASVNVTPIPQRVVTVRIVPDNVDVYVAAGTTLVATPYDNKGNTVTGRSVVWTTNNAAVASISQNGQVTGLVPGTAVVTAVIDGISGNAAITVRPVPVSRVTVSPPSVSVALGKATTLTARTTDANGNILANRPITWSSGDTRIATVDASGVVRGVRRGTVVITATSEGKLGTASVSVQ